VQVNNAILRTSQVSSAITLLNQQGSSVIQGSMQLIPVSNSIIYVRPFYAQSRQEGGFPQFQFVVVYSQGTGDAYCGQTVQDGLNQLLKLEPATPCSSQLTTGPGTTGTGTTSTTTTTTTPGSATTIPSTTGPTTTTIPPATGTKEQLLDQAAKDLDDAQAALTSGDLAGYQRLVNAARTAVKQAQTAPG
jgi:uncharacterized membrane protein (UPF0182 family)